MAAMDIFEGDAFTIVELTRALENIPYKPALLSGSNLFSPRGVRSRTVVIDDTAVVGSVGWTVQSVMNSEEVSIQLSSGHAANEICRLLDVVWKAHQLPATETGHGSV